MQYTYTHIDQKTKPFTKTLTLKKSDLKGRREYLFGFNGQEVDGEVAGAGNSVVFKYRIHDPRLGRFLSVDPLAKEYPWNSTYAFAENKVIWAMDLEGLEAYYTNDGTYLGPVGDSKEVRSIDTKGKSMNQELLFYIHQANSKDSEVAENAKSKLEEMSQNVHYNHDIFLAVASFAYSESSQLEIEESWAVAGAIVNYDIQHPNRSTMSNITRMRNNWNHEEYLKHNAQYRAFHDMTPQQRNNVENMKNAIHGTIQTFCGKDYSCGATQWDGVEQGAMPGTQQYHYNSRLGNLNSHAFSMGWNILDEHYKKWSDNLTNYKSLNLLWWNKQFGTNGFVAPQKSKSKGTGSYEHNKGKIRLHSRAVYGGTIFWQIK